MMTEETVIINMINKREVKTTEKIQIICISIKEGQKITAIQGLKQIFKKEGSRI